MQKAYKDLDIQFLPNNIVDELTQKKLTVELSSIREALIYQNNSIPTEVLSKHHSFQTNEIIDNLNLLNDHFHNFFMIHIDKLL